MPSLGERLLWETVGGREPAGGHRKGRGGIEKGLVEMGGGRRTETENKSPAL